MLTIAQVIRHETVKAAMEGGLQNAQAAASLGISVRQPQRLKRTVQKDNTVFYEGKSRQLLPSANRRPESLRGDVFPLA
ncbi:MAG: hypothetical protein JRI97_12360 [Deltaproteobacteria bacterium]|nr:hypothetical protein [Deltaproteobacteria bacterium]